MCQNYRQYFDNSTCQNYKIDSLECVYVNIFMVSFEARQVRMINELSEY